MVAARLVEAEVCLPGVVTLARFHPPKPRRGAMFGEQEIFDRLRQLDDSWLVLHGLHFAWTTRRGARMGESDFVLMHPKHGLLVLEVKDAHYRLEARTWYRQPKNRPEVRDDSPFEQAASNRYKIAKLLQDGGVGRVPIGHCVVFAAGRPSGNLGPDAPAAIVHTLASFDDAATTISDIVKHWDTGGWRRAADFGTAVEILSPQAQIAPTLAYAVDVSLGELHRLTDHQVQLTTRQLEAIRATSESPASLILGAAGTGKTFVAYAYARMLAAEKHSVAMVGAQKQLRLLTRRVLSNTGVAVGEIFDVLNAVYNPAEIAQFAGRTAWETTIELAGAFGPRLDALIVDEAQSLDSDLLDALCELLIPGGQLVLLADPYQRDATGTWRPTGAYSEYWLTENCRNTLPIARLVARASGAPTPVAGAAGRSPQFDAGMFSDYGAVAAAVGGDLTALGSTKVVVLTRTEKGANRMFNALRTSGHRVSRGVRDGRIAVCTVDQFRGCEAHAVVYLAEPAPGYDLRTIDYIATSRACTYLRVVGVEREWTTLSYLFERQTGST